VSRDLVVMTGLDPVIHEECSSVEADGRNTSRHDDCGSRDFTLQTFIVVQS
jgi:hypothetical protein